MRKETRNGIFYIAVILLGCAVDRAVKLWASASLPSRQGGTLAVIENVFHLTYVENRGAAFGMLQGQYTFFYIITGAAVLALIWVLFVRPPKRLIAGSGLALVMAGALGNLYDRAVYGFVVDMFDLRLINFAVFNVADACINVGIVIWAVCFIAADVREAKAKKALGNGGDQA